MTPAGVADSLDNAIGSATDIDPATLLALTPDSIATIMQVSGVDPKVTEYIALGVRCCSRPAITRMRAMSRRLCSAWSRGLPSRENIRARCERLRCRPRVHGAFSWVRGACLIAWHRCASPLRPSCSAGRGSADPVNSACLLTPAAALGAVGCVWVRSRKRFLAP